MRESFFILMEVKETSELPTRSVTRPGVLSSIPIISSQFTQEIPNTKQGLLSQKMTTKKHRNLYTFKIIQR